MQNNIVDVLAFLIHNLPTHQFSSAEPPFAQSFFKQPPAFHPAITVVVVVDALSGAHSVVVP